MRFGKFECFRIALGCQTVDVRTARIWQPHGLGALVKCLAGSIVDGASEYFHVIIVPHQDNLAVATRNEQAQERVGRYLILWRTTHEMAEHMAMKMIHINNGNAQSQRKSLCETRAYQQGAQQSRAAGESYGAQVAL